MTRAEVVFGALSSTLFAAGLSLLVVWAWTSDERWGGTAGVVLLAFCGTGFAWALAWVKNDDRDDEN